jgi:hypothetical protein
MTRLSSACRVSEQRRNVFLQGVCNAEPSCFRCRAGRRDGCDSIGDRHRGSVNQSAGSTGFCEESASNPTDKQAVANVSAALAKGGNKLLNMSADCQQLADWRARKRKDLDDYNQYQTPTAQMDELVASPEALIKDSCQILRKQGGQIVANTTADVKAAIEETVKKVKLNEMSFIGVLAEDATACYFAELVKLQADNNSEKTQIALAAITVIKNKTIYVDRYTLYKDRDTAASLLDPLKATVAALYAANK